MPVNYLTGCHGDYTRQPYITKR